MNQERLKIIYQKTDGYCHICRKKLAFYNYGAHDAKGSWQIEHSIARANGGSDHLNNLFAACIICNLVKGTKPSRTARAKHGHSRAPFSKTKKQVLLKRNMFAGAVIGGLFGSLLGPEGVIICASIGAAIAKRNSPKK